MIILKEHDSPSVLTKYMTFPLLTAPPLSIMMGDFPPSLHSNAIFLLIVGGGCGLW